MLPAEDRREPITVNRRRFLQCIVAAAATPSLLTACSVPGRGRRYQTLASDPREVLDLAPGLEYRIISRCGDRMSDRLRVPGAHDGMAAFAGDDGRVVIICNHELDFGYRTESAMRDRYPAFPKEHLARFYDDGRGISPGLGGTTTTIYNPVTQKVERQFLSLGGTELNCAGGPTPWGSWLSCEECFEDASDRSFGRYREVRAQNHGYVFEVPAAANELVEAVPIPAMGRFEHEACAVHEATGIVYMTEDRHHSLFYRYIPDVPGELHKGGRLQALAVADTTSLHTHNWDGEGDMPLRRPLKTNWIDLDYVDPVENDLRLRGAEQGAAMFARGEGICVADDRFAFTCTIGGPRRLGQIFTYKPSPFEGTPQENDEPGQLELIAEASLDSLLRNADNLIMTPWGDLFVCEDTASECGIVGIRPDGSQYEVASNRFTLSELAGVCFSPDGRTMFVNIQYPGMTLAVTGDWNQFVS
jgi:secreted PhoX family phosphatase